MSSAPLDQLLISFKRWLYLHHYQPNTVRNYLADLGKYLTYVNHLPQSISDDLLDTQKTHFLSPEIVSLYVSYLSDKTNSRRYLSSLNLFCQFAIDQHLLVKNPLKAALKTASSPTPSGIEHYLHLFEQTLIHQKASQSTIKNYINDLNQYINWASKVSNNHSITLINHSLFQDYSAYLNQQGLSLASIKRKLSSLSTFEKYLFKSHLLTPVPSIPKFKLNLPKFSFSFNRYLVGAAILLILAGLGYGLYSQTILKAKKNLAYSTAATPIVPNRILSFQGRLTDSSGNPIVAPTNVIFKLFTADTGGTQLYASDTGNSQTVVPDTNGIFSVVIGKTHGAAIPSTVFTENPDVFLEITAASETMTPRQQIATVGYALNSESLQGLPPSASGFKNTVLVIDGNGNLNLGETSPTIISNSGTLGIIGQAVLIGTSDGSGGNITINPDANGIIKLIAEGTGTTAGGFIEATNANLTSGNLYSAVIRNPNRNYNFLDFSNYNIGTTQLESRFSVTASGSVNVGATLNAATISIGSSLISSSASEINLLRGLNTTTGSLIMGIGTSLTNLNPGNAGYLLASNGTGSTLSWISTSSIGTTYGATNGLSLNSNNFGLGGTLTQNTQIGTSSFGLSFTGSSGSQALYIGTNSNIGIGTTSTTYALNANGMIYTNNWLKLDNGYGIFWGSSTDTSISASSNTNTMTFNIGGTKALYINSSRNVGIGTTNPSKKLDIVGDLNLTGTIFAAGTSGSSGQVLSSTGTGLSWIDTSSIGTTYTATNGLNLTGSAFGLGGTLTENTQIGTSSFDLSFLGLGGTQSLFIDSSGSVGIGTTDPNDAKLYTYQNYLSGGQAHNIHNIATNVPIMDGFSVIKNELDFGNNQDGDNFANIIDNAGVVSGANNGIAGLFNDLSTTNGSSSETIIGTYNVLTLKGNSDQVAIGLNNYMIGSSGTATGVKTTFSWPASGTMYGEQVVFEAGVGGTKWGLYINGENKNYFSGNVGIGTTNPSKKLDIAGDINLTGTIFAAGTSGSSGQVLSSTGTGLSWISTSSIGTTYGATNGLSLNSNKFGLGGTLIQNTTIGTSSFDLSFLGLGNTQSLYLKSNGYVGIGTASPNYPFHLKVGNNPDGISGYSMTPSAVIINTTATAGQSGLLVATGRNGSDSSIFTAGFKNVATNVYTSYLEVLGNGRVGIGTTNPQALLDINENLKVGTYANIGTNLSVGGSVTFSGLPLGTGSTVLYISSTGNLVTGTLPAGTTYTATNGLNLTGSAFGLGGTLTQNTRLNIGNTEVMYFSYPTGYVGIGTTNPNNLFQVANLIDFNNTDYNTKIGYQAGKNIVSGAAQNTFLGYQAGLSSSGSSTNAADYNSAIGYQSLYSNTTGSGNSVIGYQSLYFNTTGFSNTASGYQSLYSNISGSGNSAIGNYSLYSNTSGGSNTAFGHGSGFYSQNGSSNVFIGYQTAYGSVGYSGASNNTIIGTMAGYNFGASQTGNVFLGYRAGYNETGSNKLYIANSSSTPLIYGDFSSVEVGIGTTDPLATLDINGSLKVGTSVTFSGLPLGTGSTVLYISSTGNLVAGTLPSGGSTYTATNGLNLTGSAFGLGGTLTQTSYTNINIGTGSSGLSILGINNNTHALTIRANGYVGIGTTNPSSKLSLNGMFNASADSNSYTASGTAAIFAHSGLSGSYGTSRGLITGVLSSSSASDAAGYLETWAGSLAKGLVIKQSGTGNILELMDDTTAAMVVENGGYVGIGVSNPAYTLDIGGSGNLNLTGTIFAAGTTGSSGQVLSSNGAGGLAWITVSGGSSSATNGLSLISSSIGLGGTLTQNTQIGTSSFGLSFLGLGGTQSLFIDSSGRVGIGTTNPSREMEIAGNLRISPSSSVISSESFTNATFPPSGFTVGTGASGFGRDTTTYNSSPASARSSLVGTTIPNSGMAWMETGTTIPSGQTGSVKFYWKVSSENNYDFLAVCIDTPTCTISSGYNQRISGTVDWTKVEIPLANGSHTIRWIYGKDSSGIGGSDTGWVDDIVFSPSSYGFSIDGNVSIGSTSPLGKLHVSVGSTSALLVTDTGNVGIGTTNPVSKLSLNGSFNISADSGILSNITPANTAILAHRAYNGSMASTGLITSLAYSSSSADSSGFFQAGISAKGLVVNQMGTGNILELMDNTTAAMVVKDGGYVGIGVSNPAYTLDIGGSGNLNLTGTIFAAGTTGSSGQVLSSNGAGGLTWATVSSGSSSATNGLSLISSSIGLGGTLTQNTRLNIGNTEVMYLSYPTGYVGIGTTNPQYPLEIGYTNSTNESIKILGNIRGNRFVSNTQYDKFFLDPGNSDFNSSSLSLHVNGSAKWNAIYDTNTSKWINVINASSSRIQGYNSGLGFDVNIGSTGVGDSIAWNSNLFLKGNGYVGVGTTDPSQKFTVYDSGDPVLLVNSGAARYPEIRLADGYDTAQIQWDGANNWLRIKNNTSGSTRNIILESASNSNSLVVQGDGNVGIGVASPTAKLQVGGNIYPSVNLTYDLGSSSLRWNNAWIKTVNIGSSTWSLQSPDNSRLSFFNSGTGGTESMTLLPSGSVGIGTTSPGTKLDVSGQLRIGGASTISDYDSLLVGARAAADSTSSIRLAPYSNVARGWKLDAYDNNSTTYFQIYDQTSSASRFYINSSGNVGIGTINPAAKLHILNSSDTGTSPLVIENSSTANNVTKYVGMLFRGSDTTSASKNAALISTIPGDANWTTSNLAFSTLTSDYSLQEKMRITSSGNLGIGISNPIAQTEIFGPTQNTSALADSGNRGGMLSLNGNSSGAGSGGALVFGNNQSHTANSLGFAAIKGLLTDGSNNTTGDLAISMRSASTDTALSERVRITTGGNVGIGTTSPQKQLHIKGSSWGSLRLEGNGNPWDIATAWNYSNSDLVFSVNSVEAARFNGSGYLGIGGVTSPVAMLHLSSTTAQSLTNGFTHVRLETDASGSDALWATGPQITFSQRWQNAAGPVRIGGIRSIKTTGTGNYGGGIQLLYQSSSDVNMSPGLTLNSSGYVGIGTTNPQAALHVAGGFRSGAIATNDTNIEINQYGSGNRYGFIDFHADDTYTDYSLRIIRNPGVNADTSISNRGSGRVYVQSESNGVYLAYQGTSWSSNSDIRLKNVTSNFTNALDDVMQLNPIHFTWKSDSTNRPQVGLIAQDVQKVLPEAISTDAEGYLGVRYTEVIPLLTAAIQELNLKLNDLSVADNGQIDIGYNVSPEVLASLGYSDSKNEIESASYNLVDAAGKTVTKLGQYAKLAAAEISAGLISTENLIAKNIVAESTKSKTLQTAVISPLSDLTDTVVVDGQLAATGIAATSVTTDTLIANTATFSTLYANRVVSQEGDFGQLLTAKISSLRSELQSFIASTTAPESTPSALAAESQFWTADLGTSQVEITGSMSLSDNLVIGAKLAVLGDTALANAFISGTFTAGQVTIKDNLVSTTAQALYIQPSGVGSIHLLNDTMVIADNGEVTITGKLTLNGTLTAQSASISGSLFANLIHASEGTIDNLSTSKINVATDSGTIIAAGQLPSAASASAGLATSNASAGTTTLPAGKTDLVVYNSKLTPASMVYLTPNGSTQNQVLYVKNKNIGDSVPSFTIGVDSTLPTDLSVNWWIIN